MMPKIATKTYRTWILLFVVVLLAAFPVSTVSAALRTCRTDPIVSLSDGHKVSLSATIATDAANVNMIHYTLHVPRGVTVTNVVFTSAFASKEMIMVWFDQPAGTYETETVVHTNQGVVDVSATTMLMVGVSNTGNGRSGEKIRVQVLDPGIGSRDAIRNGRH